LKVIINAAMTVDGKIATVAGKLAISSQEDLQRVHALRSSVDGIVVGISTVLIDNPRLTNRLAKANGKNPTRIIIDSAAKIPLNSNILQTTSRIRTIIATTSRADRNRIKKIQQTGAMVIVAGRKQVNLKEVFSFLKKSGFRKVLVEGGGEINWSVLKSGIVSELIVTIAPKIVGGRSATTLVDGDGYTNVEEAIKLKLRRIIRQNTGEIILHYQV
jgi:2,5-diamino-6-(ribosylamino)-4(3H)-pyrimidinone 5'-phosphate reductase